MKDGGVAVRCWGTISRLMLHARHRRGRGIVDRSGDHRVVDERVGLGFKWWMPGSGLNRQRLSNVYSVRARSSCPEISRVVWNAKFQDRREIPGHVEIGRAVTAAQ